MKKNIISIFLLLLLLASSFLAFTSCGDKDKDGKKDEEPESYTTYEDMKKAAPSLGAFREFKADEIPDGQIEMGAVAAFGVVFENPEDIDSADYAVTVYKCKDVSSAKSFVSITNETLGATMGWTAKRVNDVVVVGHPDFVNAVIDSIN